MHLIDDRTLVLGFVALPRHVCIYQHVFFSIYAHISYKQRSLDQYNTTLYTNGTNRSSYIC